MLFWPCLTCFLFIFGFAKARFLHWENVLYTVHAHLEKQTLKLTYFYQVPLTYQGGQGWGEDRAALDNKRHPGTHKHRQVSWQPAKRIWEVWEEKKKSHVCIYNNPAILFYLLHNLFLYLYSLSWVLLAAYLDIQRTLPLPARVLNGGSGNSKACPPVLMTVWMTFATWPLRSELSSLTRSSRQVQRTAREPASRISPTARSDSCDDTNKCLPEERQDHRNSAHTVSQRAGLTEHY